MHTISSYNFCCKKTLVRVDFNVPLDADFNIMDDSRLRASIPTIKKIISDGGSVILMSHLGRPKGVVSEKYSLKYLVQHLNKLINEELGCSINLFFVNNCIGENVISKCNSLKEKEVLLLENLRFHKEEESGDEIFSKQLADLGDVFVNDAFGTAHRAHASTTIIAKHFAPENRFFGFLMEAEIKNAEKVLHKAEKPFCAIIGGAKVSDKILIIENLLDRVTDIIIGGGMAYTFIKAQGGKIGNSLCEIDRLETVKNILSKAAAKNVVIHLPIDSIIADKFSKDAETSESDSNNISEEWMGLDIGSKAAEHFGNVIKNCKTILWNGPMGVFEMEKFQKGTLSIAKAVAEATQQGSFSIVGGGDSIAAVNKFGFADKVSYVSTGGGAMLEYFEGKTLPGIAAIKSI